MTKPPPFPGEAGERPRSVVSFCELTGNMVRPWAQAGYSCVCYDWQHSIRADRVEGNITYRWADVRQLTLEDLPADVAIAFAFPECTNLAVSGARDFQRKGIQGLIDGLTLVEACRKLCCSLRCPWVLENPISVLSSCWRKPDAIVQPWMFGTPESKATCLWTGGGFKIPAPLVIDKPANVVEKVWKMPPGKERANLRAVTPETFARAVYDANAPMLAKGVA